MKSDIRYKSFIYSATKITLFCLLLSGLFKVLGASNNLILVVFNMAVMSSAATFTPGQKSPLWFVCLGSSVVVLSVVSAGLIGFYSPLLAQILVIAYATLAFRFTNTLGSRTIFVTGGALSFMIFTFLPFNLSTGTTYLAAGFLLIMLMMLFHWIFSFRTPFANTVESYAVHVNTHLPSVIVLMALLLAWPVAALLKSYTVITHLYWIALTILVCMQGTERQSVNTAIMRIIVNIVGALLVVVLFGYIIPADFLMNFIVLTVFLFLIFALGFSYFARTLFIEMFILGFTHLMGAYHNMLAYDRVILTLIGGAILICVSLLVNLVMSRRGRVI